MANRNSNRRITNIKGDMNAGTKIGNNNVNNIAVSSESNIKNNHIVKNSDNRKRIYRKSRNRKPRLEKTIESGYYGDAIDEMLDIRTGAPSIQEISFMRPNLERLIDGEEVLMIAYVAEKRTKESDARFVLKSVCTVDGYLSDHLIVKDCKNKSLEKYVGQVITFVGKPYRYGDKISVTVSQHKKFVRSHKRKPISTSMIITDDEKDAVARILKETSHSVKTEILSKLLGRLNALSTTHFGSSKFVIGLLIDIFFMSTKNEMFDTLNHDIKLFSGPNIHKHLLAISHLIYMLDTERIYSYADLEREIVYVSSMINMMPYVEELEDGCINTEAFTNFCSSIGISGSEIKNRLKYVRKTYNMNQHQESIRCDKMTKRDILTATTYSFKLM